MLNPQTTVASLVLDHSECARVFSKLGIDFCCGGGATLAEACAKRGIELDRAIAELERAIATASPDAFDVRTLSDGALIAYIVREFHEPLRTQLPFLQQLGDKVARVHGKREERLVEIARCVQELVGALVPHLDEEERFIFPAFLAGDSSRSAEHGWELRDDHVAIGNMLVEIRRLTDGFTLPMAACTSYRTLFAELEKLEDAIHRHVHVENNVLLPRMKA